MRIGKQIVIGFCAALPTPVLIFLTTANDRYLSNQNDFGLDTSLLAPYLVLSAVACLLGTGLYLGASSRPVQLLLWGYYLLGPAYLAYRIPRKLHWMAFQSALEGIRDDVVTLLIAACFVAVVTYLYRKNYDARVIAGVLAVIGVLLAANEAYQFRSRAMSVDTQISLHERFSKATDDAVARSTSVDRDFANIYHLIMDGFQTEMFEFAFSDEERNELLQGFQFFPENATVYGRTIFSIPSTFFGVPFDYESGQVGYVSSHFDSTESFLHSLVDAGYVTCGFHTFPNQFGAPESLFTHSVRHNEVVVVGQSDNAETFRSLWLVSCFPELIYERFTDEATVRALKTNTLTPSAGPIKSALSFQKYLELEDDLSARNRYTFLHLMVPHPPYVLGCDCSASISEDDAISEGEAYIGQIMCAKTIVLQLVDTLKRLGRYDSSMIVIHGDHGFYADIQDEKLTDLCWGNDIEPEYVNQHADRFARARSRALLLIKPPADRGGDSPFQRHTAESSLIDIAPTILEAVGITSQIEFAGYSLLHPEEVPAGRVRFYHFHDFIMDANKRFLAEKMHRWKITGQEFVADSVIPLESTLPN